VSPEVLKNRTNDALIGYNRAPHSCISLTPGIHRGGQPTSDFTDQLFPVLSKWAGANKLKA
jgi:hypothetical protein